MRWGAGEDRKTRPLIGRVAIVLTGASHLFFFLVSTAFCNYTLRRGSPTTCMGGQAGPSCSQTGELHAETRRSQAEPPIGVVKPSRRMDRRRNASGRCVPLVTAGDKRLVSFRRRICNASTWVPDCAGSVCVCLCFYLPLLATRPCAVENARITKKRKT